MWPFMLEPFLTDSTFKGATRQSGATIHASALVASVPPVLPCEHQRNFHESLKHGAPFALGVSAVGHKKIPVTAFISGVGEGESGTGRYQANWGLSGSISSTHDASIAVPRQVVGSVGTLHKRQGIGTFPADGCFATAATVVGDQLSNTRTAPSTTSGNTSCVSLSPVVSRVSWLSLGLHGHKVVAEEFRGVFGDISMALTISVCPPTVEDNGVSITSTSTSTNFGRTPTS